MAEYKRKNVKKLKAQKPKRSSVADNYKVTSFGNDGFADDISVKSAKEAKAERRFEKKKEKYLKREHPQKRVVNSSRTPKELNRSSNPLVVMKGNKNAKRIKNLTSLATAVIIIAILFSINVLSPTGIADLLKCSFSRMGSGSGFPLTVNGGTVFDVKNIDGCITVLSDTHIEVYNSESKELLSEQHKYSSPKIIASKTRALIYDQGATELSVYDVSGMVFKREMKESIVTAAIGRNGTYCVITDPENIAAKAYVYDKNNNLLYKWESENDLINAAAVSNSGKYIVLATVNAQNGEYLSQLKVFNKKDAKPIKEEKADQLIYSVEPLGSADFVMRLGNDLKKYSANNGTMNDISEDAIRQKYNNHNGEIALISASGGKTDNFALFNNKFEKNREFKIISSPKNIAWNNNYLVCSKDYSLYVYDTNGAEINKIQTSSPIEWFIINKNKIIAVSNSTIVSYEVTGGDN